MSTPERSLQVVTGGLNKFPADKIELIKNTVAKGTTNDELEMFLYLAAQYNLDPFKKEIWCIKYDSRSPATITTSRDGYLKIAMADPDYDGLKSFVVREGDTFEIDTQSDQVVHKFGAKRGGILGAWAIAYHKRRRPQITFVDYQEYKKDTQIWRQYPSAMIQKVAETFVLKRQFSISGLVTQEEIGMDDFGPTTTITEPVQQESADDIKVKWLEMANELHTLAEQNGITKDELRSMGHRITGKANPKQWTVTDMSRIEDYINQPVPQADEVPASEQTFELPRDEDLPF